MASKSADQASELQYSIMYKMMYTNVYVHDSKCRFLHKIIQRPQAMILYEKTLSIDQYVIYHCIYMTFCRPTYGSRGC